MFHIPIVLMTFRRADGLKKIINVLREIRPVKIYVLSDGGRNETEWHDVRQCRAVVDEEIDWECTVVKYFATENCGVYQNIAMGAKKVFENEVTAIFLEDDNLPEATFFRYCEEMLAKYENDVRVLWVCGTNYLGRYKGKTNESYYFTQHLLPCGWASWRDKFIKYYDFTLTNYSNRREQQIKKSFINKKLFRQQFDGVKREALRKQRGEKFHSWDYHMLFSLVDNHMYGVVPGNNQIRNIGIDDVSEHGFHKPDRHTLNLCGMESYPMKFPLVHPKTVVSSPELDRALTRKILLPFPQRVKGYLVRFIRWILRIPEGRRLISFIQRGHSL